MVQSSSESTLRKDLGLVVLALLVVTAVSLGFGGVGTLFGLVWLLGSVAVTLAFLYLLYRLVGGRTHRGSPGAPRAGGRTAGYTFEERG